MISVISIATRTRDKAPARYSSHFPHSRVSGGNDGGADGGGGSGVGSNDSGGGVGSASGGSVLKAPTALQALAVAEPIALTFQ